MFKLIEISKHIDIKNIVYFESIDSTNIKGIEYAKNGINDFLIIASEQTKGRGRFNRKWYSQKGGLYISLGMNINKVDFPLQLLNIIASMSVMNMLKKRGIDKTMYKWPNDVYINNKKISGILSEILNECVIIGIGINVNQNEFNNEINDIAISMHNISNKNYKLEYICIDIVKGIFDIMANKDLVYDFLRNNTMIGKRVHINSKQFNGIGRVKAINNDGKLILICDNKELEIIEGDVKII